MKKIMFGLLGVVVYASVFSQVSKNVPAVKSNAHIKMFNLAVSTGDLNSGITALNYFIAEQGANTPYAAGFFYAMLLLGR